MTLSPQAVLDFAGLFQGFDEAFGTGKGSWIERAPNVDDFTRHLRGEGSGIGIGPLRRDGTVTFAAIDLDEPDFEAAQEMQEFLPGRTIIERSRSGNAHVWAFFSAPVEAWIVRGIMKEATLAAGKAHVEVFPKQDGWHDGIKFGSYINLPYHGDSRPAIYWREDGSMGDYPLIRFLEIAYQFRQDPDAWRQRARWLLIEPPGQRERTTEFGAGKELHMCAEHIIAMRDENPVVEGHRNAVFWALAKMLLHYEGFDKDEALYMMKLVNESSPDPLGLSEIKRLLRNAETGQWTSTDCDNPLVAPYTHPDCPIAHPRR